MPDYKYRRLLRSLLLPINLSKEDICADVLNRCLTDKLGDNLDEHFNWLENQLEGWHETGTPTAELLQIIKDVLLAGGSDYSEIISTNYFTAHNELVKNQLVTCEQARSFLSHLLLIIRLADEEKMSSAQISTILDAMNPSAGFNRRSIEAILKKMRMAPSLTVQNIEALFEIDNELSIIEFGDSELIECAQDIAIIATRLGYKQDIGSDLLKLIDQTDVSKYTPYLQILHYQCSILEYYDHNPKDFYEFAPRGQAALSLFHYYPAAMVGAGNPFLNNAKSVGQINFPWAAAKKNKEFPGASALFNILNGLDELGYAAKQELALWIRCFIHRFMKFAIPLETPLPQELFEDDYIKLVENVGIRNTETRGIIEQRIVDAIGTQLHSTNDGWISRGIGDSVNASNSSKKKLGDCDFQKISDYSVIAYEAHGGNLTQTYLDEHIRTLRKSMSPRINEWLTFSTPGDWSVEIVFVAHDFNAQEPDDIIINDVRISIRFVNYNDLVMQLNGYVQKDAFNRLILNPLSQKRTPSFVRQKFLRLIER